METTTSELTEHADGPLPGLALADGSSISEAAIAYTRTAVIANNGKLRRGVVTTVDTDTLKCHGWPVIQMWWKPKRRYTTLDVGGCWRFETEEERDRVLALLCSNGRDEGRAGLNQPKQFDQ